jgi:hypothetical protein
MAAEDDLHRLGMSISEAGAALDIGEQERDRARRQRCRGIHRFALRDHVGQAEADSLGAPTPMPTSPIVGPPASHGRAGALQATVVIDCTGTG